MLDKLRAAWTKWRQDRREYAFQRARHKQERGRDSPLSTASKEERAWQAHRRIGRDD